MQSSDVLIVGGGPAGATVAWKLGQTGLRVCLVDRRQFPRDKTCAGWITPAVVESLQIDRNSYAQQNVWQPITGFRSGVIGSEPVETRYETPVSYGIRRCEFDHYLLQRSGAECHFGMPIKQLERRDGIWTLNNQWSAPLLIGAGGHFCPVARQLGARQNRQASVVTAQEVEFEIPPDRQRQVAMTGTMPELYFCRDLAGYGWCFRKGNYLNIGLGRIESHALTQHLDEFCNFLRERRQLTVEIPALFRGHAYQLYERTPPKLYEAGVLLVGDAAGLAYPQSGEGIRPAVESGLLAAEVIEQAAGRYDAETLAAYGERIEERFGRPRTASTVGWLPAAWLQFLAARLLANRSFSRHVVLDRWFLHRQQPALRV